MFVDVTPPNLNAELYKNHQEINKAYNHLSFITIHKGGTTVLGASDLTGRHWDGCIQVSRTSWDFVLQSCSESNITKIFSEKSVIDGKFLKDPTKFIVADDSGELKIWSQQNTWTESGASTQQRGWCVTAGLAEHDDGVLAIDLFPDAERCISAGADCVIKVWDLEKLVSLMTYPAHSHIVTDAMCNPYTKDVFLSSSLDKTVAVWHYKGTENKAKVFGKAPCGVRCVSWITEHLFAAGYDNGDICFYDSRYESTDEILPSINSKSPIERMKYDNESKQLAVCGDSSSVDVYRISEINYKNVYSNDTAHSQFVRGLEWNDNHLYSCGWDGKVVNHNIETGNIHEKYSF